MKRISDAMVGWEPVPGDLPEPQVAGAKELPTFAEGIGDVPEKSDYPRRVNEFKVIVPTAPGRADQAAANALDKGIWRPLYAG
jgi:hypothetical protein